VNVIRTYGAARTAAIVWLFASMTAGIYSLVDYYYANPNPTTEASMGLTSNRFSTVESDAAEIRTLGTNVLRLYGTTAHPTLFGLNMTMAVPFFRVGNSRSARRSGEAVLDRRADDCCGMYLS